jgi:hypothetical protein
MGMLASVFRNPLGDCTNDGLSSKYSTVVIVNVPGPFKPDDKYPAVQLELCYGNVIAKPVVNDSEYKPWFMFGGNFLYTSDSRFRETLEEMLGHKFYGAIPIHDRVE